MPQLDVWTFGGQVTWACTAFLGVFLVSKVYLLPSRAVSLKTPNKLVSVLSGSSSAMDAELAYTRSV